jgi:hypothetical protein
MSERRARSKRSFRWQWEESIREDYRIPMHAMGTILLMSQYASTTTGTNLYKAVADVALMRKVDADTLGDHIKIAVRLGWFVNEGRIKGRKSNTYHLAIPADHPVYVRKDAVATEAAARKTRAGRSGRKPLIAVDLAPRSPAHPTAAELDREREISVARFYGEQ